MVENEETIKETEKYIIKRYQDPSTTEGIISYMVCIVKKDGTRINEEDEEDIERNLQNFGKWEKIKELKSYERELEEN